VDADVSDDSFSRHELMNLGISLDEEIVYRTLLREPKLGLPALATALDRPVAGIVERLVALGMVQTSADNELVAVSPGVAVERLIERRLQDIQSQLHQLMSAPHLVAGFLRDERKDGAAQTGVGVEVVEGLDQVRALIEELSFYTYKEMLAIQPAAAFSAAAIAATRRVDLRCLRRGVTMRTIVRREILDDGPTAAYLEELATRGAQIRLAEGPLERMLVFDRTTCVVPLDPQTTSRGALVIRAAGLISGLVTLFERAWAEAKIRLFDSTPAEPAPSETERAVLQALARGDKDEAGARAIGISVRTYRSHVASLVQRLGAESRFQAALLARERGWL
jgi:DNA-binding CsgD family transcriptional regulator/sugar-specific transcriptional regulator TrmB